MKFNISRFFLNYVLFIGIFCENQPLIRKVDFLIASPKTLLVLTRRSMFSREGDVWYENYGIQNMSLYTRLRKLQSLIYKEEKLNSTMLHVKLISKYKDDI